MGDSRLLLPIEKRQKYVSEEQLRDYITALPGARSNTTGHDDFPQESEVNITGPSRTFDNANDSERERKYRERLRALLRGSPMNLQEPKGLQTDGMMQENSNFTTYVTSSNSLPKGDQDSPSSEDDSYWSLYANDWKTTDISPLPPV